MAKADQNAKNPVARLATAPLNPYLVLLAAILLPGYGQVLCGETRRGFTLQMFMIVLGIVTWHLAPEGASLVGKLAGGLFVYALSVFDAYSIASRRWLAFNKGQNGSEAAR